MNPRTLHRLALITAAGFASSSPAQQPALLEETVVVGKRSDLLGIVPAASEGSASGEELRARPLLRRGEALEAVPGMVVTQHAGGGKANQYFLRGFNLDHGTDFAISIDRMPVNMRTHSHGQGYADLNILMPEVVERVDYHKGTYTARDGDLSSAGSADFRLIDAFAKGFATFELGEYGYYRGAIGDTLWFGKGDNAPRLTLAAEYNHYDGPWVLPEDFNRWNGFARYFAGDADNNFSLTLMGYRGEWQSTDQIPQRAIESGEISRFGYVDPTNGGESQRYSLQLHWQHSESPTVTKLNLYGFYYDLDLYSNFTYFLDEPERGDQFQQAEKRIVLGGDVTQTWEGMRFFSLDSDFTVGLQTRTDFIDGIGLWDTEQRDRFANTRQDDVTESSVGVFAESTVRWTPWLRTVTGLRADGFYFDNLANTPDNSGSEIAGIVSPKFSAIFGPWNKTELYFNFGTGFHSNDARGVNTTRDPSSGEAVTPVDPLVRTVGAEIGVRTQAVPKVTATLAAWWLDSGSELVYVGDEGTNEPGPASRRYGIEAAIYWAPRDWLRFDAEVAITHARFLDNPGGDYITDSVPWMISGGYTLGAQGQQPGWFTGLRVRAGLRRVAALVSARSPRTTPCKVAPPAPSTRTSATAPRAGRPSSNASTSSTGRTTISSIPTRAAFPGIPPRVSTTSISTPLSRACFAHGSRIGGDIGSRSSSVCKRSRVASASTLQPRHHFSQRAISFAQ